MKAERTSEPPRRSGPPPAAAPPPERDDVRVTASPVRCPFCHEGIAIDGDEEWVACAGCVARHHAACWDEAGRCSACGGGERLRREGAAPPATGADRPLFPALAQEPPAAGEVRRSRLLGGPYRVAHERVFDGEVSSVEAEAAWLEREARRITGVYGRAEVVGRAITWHAAQRPPHLRRGDEDCGGQGCRTHEAAATRVELTSVRGRTTLRVEERMRDLIGGLFGGIGGGVGVGGVAALGAALVGLGLVPAPLLPLAAVAWVLMVLAGTRALYAHLAERRVERAERLVERLTEGLSRGRRADAARGGAPPPRARDEQPGVERGPSKDDPPG